jgi:hypothetical protein
MNDQLRVFIQYIITGVTFFGVGRHWFTAADATALNAVLINVVVAIVGGAPTVIGIIKSSKIAKVRAVQVMPDMQVVTTSRETKIAVPDVTIASPSSQVTLTAPAPIAPKP